MQESVEEFGISDVYELREQKQIPETMLFSLELLYALLDYPVDLAGIAIQDPSDFIDFEFELQQDDGFSKPVDICIRIEPLFL